MKALISQKQKIYNIRGSPLVYIDIVTETSIKMEGYIIDKFGKFDCEVIKSVNTEDHTFMPIVKGYTGDPELG